jgi:5-methylcytosine-specific restriction endonuclease McrA
MFKKGYKSWNTGTSKTKVTITCQECGTVVDKYLYGRNEVKYCSNKCAHKHMGVWNKGIRGPNSHSWKDSKVRTFKKFLRESHDYKDWRKTIFERDDYTCQHCGKKGGYLEVHHIKGFSEILKLYNIQTYEEAISCKELWDVDNGITYCRKCHDIIGKLNSEEKQNEE